MSPSKQRLPASLAVAAALTPILAATPSTLAASTAAPPGRPTAAERALLHSHELWATIDVCSPPDQPNTVGVRGSMPGNGHARDAMYMSFRLQYMTAGKGWVDVAGGASSGWERVGDGASPRQGGASFALKAPSGKRPVTLRGVVDFQWRSGHTVLLSTVEPTSPGHKSLAGADPADYSAASCVLG